MVECVVAFTTKLQFDVLIDGEIFERGQVPLVLPGSSENNLPGVSDIAERRRCEHTRVKETASASISVRQLRIAGDVDSLAIATPDNVGATLQSEADTGGRAAGKGDDLL
jgi:hypothetical protein